MWVLFLVVLCYCMPINAKIIDITDEKSFENLVQENGKQLIVEFSANWCGACTQVKKPFEEVATESEFDTITFVCVNIDQTPNLCKKYCIDGVPTFVYIDNGKQKEKEIGVQDLRVFKDHLRGSLRKNFISPKQQQSLPRVTLLSPDDTVSAPKNNRVVYSGILTSINNTIQIFMASIKEWIGC